jgi:DNA-binding CsgD family transcriptional regulator
VAANSPKSQRGILAREREVQALELRKAGATYGEIGRQLGISASSAHRAIARAVERITDESSELAIETRRMELIRLDAMQLALWTDARKGDAEAIRTLLRIMERRARYLGLDAPTEVVADVTHHSSEIDAAIERELAGMAAGGKVPAPLAVAGAS